MDILQESGFDPIGEEADKAKTKLQQYTEFADRFPETALQILERAKKFKMNLNLGDEEIKTITLEMEKSSGNVALGFIVAALIVGSALIMQTEKWPVLSSVIFIVAASLGIWLIHRTVLIKIKKFFIKNG